MRKLTLIWICFVMLLATIAVVFGQVIKEPALEMIPKAYQDKHIPKGWWTDSNIIAEGKKIYDGAANPDVKCAKCHGPEGKPKLKGAISFQNTEYVNKMTDSYMYWRIAEGISKTLMTAMKEKLTEDQIWKVIAYSHTFSHGGKAEEHTHK